MKGKINKFGELVILRGGVNISQICKLKSSNEISDKCMHDCSLFGEPKKVKIFDCKACLTKDDCCISYCSDDDEQCESCEDKNYKKVVKLKLCKSTLIFDELKDERA